MTHLTPHSTVTTSRHAKATDQISQIRSELGWLALLEVLVGEDRARHFISQAILHGSGTEEA